MLPRPEPEFDFSLPHGISTDADQLEDSNQESTNHAADPNGQDHMDIDDAQPFTGDIDDLFVDRDDPTQPRLNYETYQSGFSDDEGHEQAFDRSMSANKARKAPPKNKKSPRRSDNDGGSDRRDDEESPKPKKPRKSLFGGPVDVDDDEDRREHVNDQVEVPPTLQTSGLGIRERMSSLNLEQAEDQDHLAEDNRPIDVGFGLGTSERDSMSPPPSEPGSEESVVIPPDDRPVYDLRKGINRQTAITYIDTDKTGDYDPATEAKLEELRRRRAKVAKKSKAKAKGKETKKKKRDKEYVPKLIVTLAFEAFGSVRNITNDEDNWPDNHSVLDSEDEEEARKSREYFRYNTPDVDMLGGIQDPRGEVDDLTGYPAARGCKQCRREDKECSMVEGGTWPCKECEYDEQSCNPIIQPTENGRCEQCAEDEQECSFEDNPDQRICDYCNANDHVCIPTPPQDYKTPRISLDEHLYGPNRKHIKCTFCRIEKKRCSLKSKTDKPPCKYCKKNGIGCTFTDIPKMPSKGKGKAPAKQKFIVGQLQDHAPEVSQPDANFFTPEDLADMNRSEDNTPSREPTPEIEMEDSAGNKGMLTKIRTSFAHPIDFSARTPSCEFCEMPSFGFVGHFERQVHVIRWHSGLGYTEIGGGHCEEKNPTLMCFACTNTRLQVIVCPDHSFQRLADSDEVVDFETITDELISAEPGSTDARYQLQRWCSMCFSPASYGCATVQPALVGEDDEQLPGCGLRLCQRCFETLRDEFQGNVEDMVGEMVKQPKVSEEDDEAGGRLEGKPRADVDFLWMGGLMMRCVNASAGEE